MTDLERRFVQGEGWQTVSVVNGGSLPETLTTTLTLNRAGGFTDQHDFDFDLGDTPTVFQLTYTLTDVTADGETWGETDLEIFAELAIFSGVFQVSDDGVAWRSIAQNIIPVFAKHGSTQSQDVLVTVNDAAVYAFYGFRYLRVGAAIWDATSFDTYAGANDPTATITVAVRYAV